MRINQFVAKATGMSRRSADRAIESGEVFLNGERAKLGVNVAETDDVTLKGVSLQLQPTRLIALHKPVGYVCSRDGQGSKTVYELLPHALYNLKPIGRLDKDSSGLLLLTDDGELANQLTHPSFGKQKVYKVTLDRMLSPKDKAKIEQGIALEDGISKLELQGSGTVWNVKMSEGRNRQIRRTFSALGYEVVKLHRPSFGEYSLKTLKPGEYETLQ